MLSDECRHFLEQMAKNCTGQRRCDKKKDVSKIIPELDESIRNKKRHNMTSLLTSKSYKCYLMNASAS